MIKLIFEIVFLVFLTLVLYIQYSRSKENAKIEEINKRDITDEEYEVLKKFFKRKVVYYIQKKRVLNGRTIYYNC